jgi:hydroxymethylpyrimidine/phosphomethylpyrimidine kinase
VRLSIRKALTVAGSDSGGGAGIQADLKTFQELGVYGMSVITAVTAQNTRGVQGIFSLDAQAVAAQLDAVAEDLPPDAVKTGMLGGSEIVQTVAERVRRYGWSNVVVDPVMIAKGGAPLLREEAVEAVKELLLPLAKVVTPNIPEAEALAGFRIRTEEDRREAARKIKAYGAQTVVIKGGHGQGEFADDLVFDGCTFAVVSGRRVHSRHTHGTGCTFAAAIAAEMAKGRDALEAVRTAKRFIQAAIEEAPGFGGGHGPTNHWAYGRRLREETSLNGAVPSE